MWNATESPVNHRFSAAQNCAPSIQSRSSGHFRAWFRPNRVTARNIRNQFAMLSKGIKTRWPRVTILPNWGFVAVLWIGRHLAGVPLPDATETASALPVHFCISLHSRPILEWSGSWCHTQSAQNIHTFIYSNDNITLAWIRWTAMSCISPKCVHVSA